MNSAALACAWCRDPFAGPRHQRYCSIRCKSRAHHAREMTRPEVVIRRRAKCVEWAAANRGVTTRNAWLVGQIPYVGHLPGGGCDLAIGGQLVAPRHVYMLHGLLSHLVGEPHVSGEPAWALLPWHTGCGWAVYWWREDLLRRFAGSRHRLRFGNADDTEVRFGSGALVKSPQVRRRGRLRVRIDTLTPVVIQKDGRSHLYTAPTSETLLSTLSASLMPRLGLGHDGTDLRLILHERHTEPDKVWCGDKLGTVSGWSGYAVVEVNAPARWLLEVAARGPGLGGRTAFGFGRIRVTEE